MFNICRIITETSDSSNSLKEFLGGYPVEITQSYSEEGYYDIPTLVIGWNSIKNNFPNQKITDYNVLENLYWTYNEEESKYIVDIDSFHKRVENFVNKNIKSWLPSDFFIYDSILHGDFFDFIKKNINNEILTYIHFNKGAIYLRNGENNFIINTKSLWLTELNYRELITNFFNTTNCLVYSYNKIEEYVNLDKLSNIRALDIIRWVKYGVETHLSYFQIIPGMDMDKYIPFMMSKVPQESIKLDEDEELFFDRMCQKDIITRWLSNRYVSFSYDFDKKLDFIYRENAKLSKLNYSTKKTLTGRIPCSDKYNPQNLSKEGEDRRKIVSRFRNGRIYQFDYTSFEARIALYLTENMSFIEHYYDKDIHSETAMIIFDSIDFTPSEREVAKLANMAIMYGASDSTAIKILKDLENPEEKLIKIKIFLEPIFKKAREIIKESSINGYLINKWGSIIRPEKDYAAFNNYLQSTASEIMVDKLFEIKNLLSDYKSQFLFQVHDSLVFDIHPNELDLVQNIAKTLSYNKGMLFTINYKSGLNYKDLSLEEVYF
jgi:hypothetical protein